MSGEYYVDRCKDIEDDIYSDDIEDVTRFEAIITWLRNHITVNGAASECTTTAGTDHDEAGGSCTLKIDHEALKGYLGGELFVLDADTDVVVHNSAEESPFDFSSDIVDVVVACYVYDNSGTPTVSGLIGTAAADGEAEAPSDSEVAAAVGSDDFVRFANVTFTASADDACAFGSTEVASMTVEEVS